MSTNWPKHRDPFKTRHRGPHVKSIHTMKQSEERFKPDLSLKVRSSLSLRAGRAAIRLHGGPSYRTSFHRKKV